MFAIPIFRFTARGNSRGTCGGFYLSKGRAYWAAVLGGAEIVRFTGAFPRGRESFSPSDVTIQFAELGFRGIPDGDATFAGDISFRCSPWKRWPVSMKRRGLRLRLFFDPIERILVPRREVAFSSWTVQSRSSALVLPSSQVFPVYRWKQDSSRALPFGFCYGFGKLSREPDDSFSRLRGGGHHSTRDADEVR